jgi:hypothetical protein
MSWRFGFGLLGFFCLDDYSFASGGWECLLLGRMYDVEWDEWLHWFTRLPGTKGAGRIRGFDDLVQAGTQERRRRKDLHAQRPR